MYITNFHQATEFPCEEVANSNGERRLHTRVAPSFLSSANVERKGVGLFKVSPPIESTNTIFFYTNTYLCHHITNNNLYNLKCVAVSSSMYKSSSK